MRATSRLGLVLLLGGLPSDRQDNEGVKSPAPCPSLRPPQNLGTRAPGPPLAERSQERQGRWLPGSVLCVQPRGLRDPGRHPPHPSPGAAARRVAMGTGRHASLCRVRAHGGFCLFWEITGERAGPACGTCKSCLTGLCAEDRPHAVVRGVHGTGARGSAAVRRVWGRRAGGQVNVQASGSRPS